MNAAVSTVTHATSLAFDVDLPQWLQNCLVAPQDSHQHSEQADNSLICLAFSFAYDLHQGQYRKSGEPYICHPIAVAGLLRDLGGSSAMIAAGFLHDVVEDTDISIEEIEQRFGNEVRQLVEGVTKLSEFSQKFSSKTERQAENFRRMFLAMAKDIRVIVVKLADRLHNMRTLEHLAPEKQRRIALETREIFAPLANRLGIGRFKWELEDLAFKYLEPEAYRQIQDLVAEKRVNREARLTRVVDVLKARMEQAEIQCIDISGRPKHLYGIYQKMQRQQKEFHEIYDIAAIRIIVNTKEECYRALAEVHDAFKPIPGRFKDYIGLPKPNRYQSLHTAVVGFTGRPLEVQIRTIEMHHIAEYGIAAHWKYKETGSSSHSQLKTSEERFTWLRQILEWQNDLKDVNDAQEYLDSVKDNLFEDDVYVFTPKGDVVSLTAGATPVDFAYRIHTEVGNHCCGARVNERMVTLDTRLKNGDIVDILTQKNSHPSLDWLNFVVTTGAKNRIRQWYKRSHREENVARGRELLEKELGKTGFEALLKSEPMQAVAEKCNYHGVEELLAALGYGEITLNLVLNRWREIIKAQQPIAQTEDVTVLPSSTKTQKEAPLPSSRASDSPIAGVEGLLYHLAKCCTPIPGESIIGVVTRNSRGISIHRQGCQNVETIEGDRLIPVSWNHNNSERNRPQTYTVNIQIEAIDRVGILKDILSRLSDQGINVRNAQVKTSNGQPALIDLGIDIRDREQLDRVFVQIKKMSDVINLRRISQAED
ncbi:bifunctional (p)ppGpp synthetase/guanosine-3',5'-bis(diphosphate) 3'-pyrophosphohydrolase [Gloeocapsopsis crepidinum LEGE 06123]|uniref:Bifunctional (P)ppGpp synthetase/guanosine-3',5'-bis(Diphosphate) 3'-pyrophosphohydrolase n=1 Tax=Gloeocapsopsis crepidinum LEGE 06123 TaxID=588587 RepID=A0ABR9UXX9_9CHRO|nr:bifunctional (p)ppGpp synthetase/guanosine-3',5'-bis(diphosphate) 3'-pyrophosphohydrolase [Gloeocapsopsis crepidinum]MBE9192845.1 bifunctional (p)ppGpp synthetase/guanosine-3',5'-bis(diphosphate) 3'-pyrophosphohydrolase [Gloeocapsopsis crepidinum LEGE 06123]